MNTMDTMDDMDGGGRVRRETAFPPKRAFSFSPLLLLFFALLRLCVKILALAFYPLKALHSLGMVFFY